MHKVADQANVMHVEEAQFACNAPPDEGGNSQGDSEEYGAVDHNFRVGRFVRFPLTVIRAPWAVATMAISHAYAPFLYCCALVVKGEAVCAVPVVPSSSQPTHTMQQRTSLHSYGIQNENHSKTCLCDNTCSVRGFEKPDAQPLRACFGSRKT